MDIDKIHEFANILSQKEEWFENEIEQVASAITQKEEELETEIKLTADTFTQGMKSSRINSNSHLSHMAKFTVNTHHAYLNNKIIIQAEDWIAIEDLSTGLKYEFQKVFETRLSAGHHILKSENHEEEIVIEDAIKLGGSKIKSAFVFDDTPWIFVTTKDRLYITNLETHEEKVEYNITPDEIMSLPAYGYRKEPNEYFIFKSRNDYAVYNVQTGKIVFQFTQYIFANEHLIIFKQEDGVEVYDFRQRRTIVHFDGQYSFGKKFYFVRRNILYGLNLSTSYINEVPSIGNIKDTDMLLENYLLKLDSRYTKQKIYSYVWLGNGEEEKTIVGTKLILPCHIESWMGNTTRIFLQIKEDYDNFKEKCRENNLVYPDLHFMCLGLKITKVYYRYEGSKRAMEIHGKLTTYPTMDFNIPFMVKGFEGDIVDFANHIIELPIQEVEEDKKNETSKTKFHLDEGEKLLGESESGNALLTKGEKGIYIHYLDKGKKYRILQKMFDTSNYANAYFTSDGKKVLLRLNNTEAQLLGLDDLTTAPFEIDGFTLAKDEGYNGYKPEVSLSDNRRPVWRDPITLNFISEKEMSNHIFKSPDGKYIAKTKMATILFNRLTKSELTSNEANEIRNKYNWSLDTSKEEKDIVIERRKQLAENSDKQELFGKIIDVCRNLFLNVANEEEKKKRCNRAIEDKIEWYITKECDFASLIIDRLGYVCYRKNEDNAEEQRLLIGRSVLYLNYVSFSYDSKYLSFAAKMNTDKFRSSQEGVFEVFDLEKKEIVNRTENVHNHQLWAVWMTMFSKNGDVAFYDSCANAYLKHKVDNYNHTEEAPGKSLLCFSPSGKFIACSDQNYIDYTHHPNGYWGHQPSGNVFIHSVENFSECLEQYNDLGDGIFGVATRAGNVSSASFSQDETKLLVVGNDGVVVIRNLKKTTSNKMLI